MQARPGGSGSEEEPQETGSGPVTVLIIDDQQSSRTELAEMVESLGYRSLCASSGIEGVAIARTASPALALVDMVMPSFDGLKVAAAIKNLPRFTPVMILTSLRSLAGKLLTRLRGCRHGRGSRAGTIS